MFRWLLAKGRVDEARTAVKRGAKWTGVTISDELLVDVGTPTKSKNLETDTESEPLSMKNVKYDVCIEYFFRQR